MKKLRKRGGYSRNVKEKGETIFLVSESKSQNLILNLKSIEAPRMQRLGASCLTFIFSKFNCKS